MGFLSSLFRTARKASSPRNWSPAANGGPLVRSGPTYGKLRSRTKSGRWRRTHT